MRKIYLLAGFFILTSSSHSFAYYNQMDTLPDKAGFHSLNFFKTDFRLSFYQWRNSSNRSAPPDPVYVDLRSNLFAQNNNAVLHLGWWPQVSRLKNNQNIGLEALTGFAQGVSTGLSATNNYYLKNAYDWEVNKSFYSISSFLVGAGLGTALGLKDPRRFRY